MRHLVGFVLGSILWWVLDFWFGFKHISTASLIPHPRDQHTTHWCLPFTSTPYPTFRTSLKLGVMAVMVLLNVGRLPFLYISLLFLRNDNVGGSLLLYIQKTSLLQFFLGNDHSRNILGQDQEFWMSDVGKWHSEEWFIQLIIVHCLYGLCTRRNEQYLWEYNT
jgi:hypothetical protein